MTTPDDNLETDDIAQETATLDRPARQPGLGCPSWCTECDVDTDGGRMHWTTLAALPGHEPTGSGDSGRAEVWAMGAGPEPEPDFCVHMELVEQTMSAAEVRATAQALLASSTGSTSKQRARHSSGEGLAPMLRELSAVRGLADDDPRRQAAVADKERLLTVLEDADQVRVVTSTWYRRDSAPPWGFYGRGGALRRGGRGRLPACDEHRVVAATTPVRLLYAIVQSPVIASPSAEYRNWTR